MTTNDSGPRPIDAPEGLTALERTFKSAANGNRVTQRLYTRPDGIAMGAVRGGPLHMADEGSWEVFMLCGGIGYGEPTGWVSDADLAKSVANLAAWTAPQVA